MISLFSNRTEAIGHTWLDEHAEQWVEHGLVTTDQVDAIRAFEQHERTEPRLSIVAELAVYLGSVLALMSGAMMVGPNWEALRTAGQVAIGLAVAALGFLAGGRLIRLDDPGTRRLASFMWLIGTGGVALTLGAVVDAAAFDEPGLEPPDHRPAGVRDRRRAVAQPSIARCRCSRPPSEPGSRSAGSARCSTTPPWIGGILVWTIAVVDRRPGGRPGAAARDVRARRRLRRGDDRRRDALRRRAS